ncbi:MAG: AMP-binding protein [Chloroflexota bacterium]|nr:AMP-binding protein [Chloroflexota bacterium]
MRDRLLTLREDLEGARREFRWPELDDFNWALDYFDTLPPDQTALWLINGDGTDDRVTFGELRVRSNRIANYLRAAGLNRGDRILLVLPNCVPLWETMLAAMKLGAVIIPAATLLTPDDLRDRVERGQVKAVVASVELAPRFAGVADTQLKIAVGGQAPRWHAYTEADDVPGNFERDAPTHASDPLLLYFTSGTTARPKLVEHTHASYPVGALSTVYWLGLQPGDVHLNISSPGWAKHAWSCFFAPWNAAATVLIFNHARFDAHKLLDTFVRCNVTTFCAPPTVWRMLIQTDLASVRTRLRELVAAGEPLNPEVIEQVRRAWGITIRDGYGQTETTALVGNSPGQPIKPGSMGRPLPGYRVVLLDPDGHEAHEGEIALDLSPRPLGLMTAYRDDPERTAEVMRGGYYHTGDTATRDADGYITYVGRTDDVFKSSDYRISPFELESVLIEHVDVAEAAVVPSPDPVRLAVPKAFVVLRAGVEPSPEVARAILAHCRDRLAPFKRVRRIEFSDLPKTISGKIRRVELRTGERNRSADQTERRPNEWWEDDFQS